VAIRWPLGTAGGAVLLSLLAGCGGSASSSPAGPAQTIVVGGTWNGTSLDPQGSAAITLALTQTGGVISGSAVMKAINDPTAARNDCAACHKNKPGTVSGTISGAAVALTMFFPNGDKDDITPACSFTIDGKALSATSASMTGTYVGGDSCEGAFTDGALRLTR
jgi:hypothetical protein